LLLREPMSRVARTLADSDPRLIVWGSLVSLDERLRSSAHREGFAILPE
jgi:hypothetical protein